MRPRRVWIVLGVAVAFAAAGSASAVGVGSSNTPKTSTTSTTRAPTPPTVSPTTFALPTATRLPVQHNSSIQFSGASDGWLVVDPGNGGPGAVESSVDQGAQWQSSLSTPDNLWGLQFVNQQDGWVVGSSSIDSTTDGGATWSVRSEPSSPLAMVDFTTPEAGWGVTRANSLVATTNGGTTWSNVSTPVPVEGACFSSNGTFGWFIGEDVIYSTSTGGRTWSLAYRSPQPSSAPLANEISCSGTDAWAQFVLGAGLGQSSELEVSTTAGAAANGWKVVGASGPGTTHFSQLGISGTFSTPVVGSHGKALLLSLCSNCGAASPQQQRVLGLQSPNIGSSLVRLTELTLANVVSAPVAALSTGAAWMCVRTHNGTNYSDLIFQVLPGSSTWHQEASIPIAP